MVTQEEGGRGMKRIKNRSGKQIQKGTAEKCEQWECSRFREVDELHCSSFISCT